MVLPQWTNKYNVSQGGRDFLGYMNVGVIMLDRLLPGISNITDRLRYYSFFSWVLYKFFKTNQFKNNKNYRKYLKIKSLAFLHANTFLHKETSGVGVDGIDLIRADIKENGERKVYEWDDDFIDRYKDNYWIYSQKMKQVGVTIDSNEYDLESLTKTWGKELAQAYEENIRDTEYFKKYCDKDDQKIPLSVLKGYASKCSVVDLDKSPKEQQLLLDLIFRFDKLKEELDDYSVYYSNSSPNKARTRRESLLLMLDMIEQVGEKSFTYEDFQKLVLYSRVQDMGYEANKDLVHCLEYWRIFQARQLLVYGIEGFFTVMTDLVFGRNVGLPDFVNEISKLTEVGLESAGKEYGIELSVDSKIKEVIKNIAGGKTGNEFDSSCNLDSKISEWNLYKNIEANVKSGEHEDCLANLVYLLLVLYLRFNYYRDKNLPCWSFGRIGEKASLSIDAFFAGIDDLVNKDLAVEDMIEWIAKELVIKQHCRVALAKLSWYKNNTFHFEYSAGRIKGIKKARPNMNAPKFRNSINFLEDLSLAQRKDKGVVITSRGKQLLNEYKK